MNAADIILNKKPYLWFFREAYTQETQNLIRKQKSEITQLESEKKELLKDLRLAESRFNQMADESNADRLKNIVEARGTSSLSYKSIIFWILTCKFLIIDALVNFLPSGNYASLFSSLKCSSKFQTNFQNLNFLPDLTVINRNTCMYDMG